MFRWNKHGHYVIKCWSCKNGNHSQLPLYHHLLPQICLSYAYRVYQQPDQQHTKKATKHVCSQLLVPIKKKKTYTRETQYVYTNNQEWCIKAYISFTETNLIKNTKYNFVQFGQNLRSGRSICKSLQCLKPPCMNFKKQKHQ